MGNTYSLSKNTKTSNNPNLQKNERGGSSVPAVPINQAQAKTTVASQLQPLQLKEHSEENPRSLEAFQLKKTESPYPNDNAQSRTLTKFEPPIQKKENTTGLPDTLKTGIESLSGFSISDVKVHYNSDRPAQLQAFAYAQGTDIHIGPGQEKHLPHEAWHVIQQKQGRVQATIQMKDGIAVNNDKGLETEADVMGAKAMQLNVVELNNISTVSTGNTHDSVMQRMEMDEFMNHGFLMKDHIPEFGMGRFDLELWPREGIANVIVRMHVNFSNEQIEKGTTPWTEIEKQQWIAGAHESVKKVWNNIAQFKIETEKWPAVKIKPKFDVSFVESKENAHITTNAVKIPQPHANKGIWNGGRNGLMQDQFVSGPMIPTRALLSDIAPKFRRDAPSDQLHHNIFAHEYGHMIGLADEYDNETDPGTGPGKRQLGNVKLMREMGADQPEWGTHTNSLMSDGTQIFLRHFVTVKAALEQITSRFLPGSTVLIGMREGSPIWMELSKEQYNLTLLIRELLKTERSMELIQIQDSIQREITFEEAQVAKVDGDMDGLAELLSSLRQQRVEYLETFINKKAAGIEWTNPKNKQKMEEYIEAFATIPWHV